jgi:DNA primase large subunit
MNDLNRFAKYPFLHDAKQYIQTICPKIDDLLDDRIYARAKWFGKNRVLASFRLDIPRERPFQSEVDQTFELLSYPIARIIVACVGDSYLVKRFAKTESELFGERLQNEDIEFILDIATQLKLDVKRFQDKMKMHFCDYLKTATRIRDRKWRLYYRDVDKGYVYLTESDLKDLIVVALNIKFETELSNMFGLIDSNISERLRHEIDDVRTEFEKFKKKYENERIKEVSVTKFPPCIQYLLGTVQSGENLSHHGRFALTAFLHLIGVETTKIVEIFSNLPNFDEAKCKYQVAHVTGMISSTEYTPPECSTMNTFGLCYNPDNLCKKEWITHPLKYYNARIKRERKDV